MTSFARSLIDRGIASNKKWNLTLTYVHFGALRPAEDKPFGSCSIQVCTVMVLRQVGLNRQTTRGFAADCDEQKSEYLQ